VRSFYPGGVMQNCGPASSLGLNAFIIKDGKTYQQALCIS